MTSPSFKDELAKISIIQDVRLRDDFNLIITDHNNQISIHNLVLEFKVDDNWFLFSDLSDGTKRIFYIISEILFPVNFTITDNDIIMPVGQIKKLILLEEPELGIHPHQLHLLSLFLKEQSKLSQIILTTHSPQLLNILDPDELDSIIISSIDKEGTHFRHLSEEEKLKAQNYMLNQAFLSDYWTFSDLEK